MKVKIFIFIILAVLLEGCSIMEDQDTPCPDLEESEFINLTFNMTVPTARETRTDDADHEEIDSEWPEFEDRIYTDDFAIYLFAVLPNGSQPFLAKIDDFISLENPFSGITGGDGHYTIQMALPKSKFEDAVATEYDKVTLKVAVFANTDKKFSNLNATDYASFNALIEKASGWDFSIFGSIYVGTGTVDGNLKSGARIPMYGTTTLEATRDQVYKSRPENPLWGGDISMLRSVAKVHVVDNISNRDLSTGLPRIESVSFYGQYKAYILPYNALNYYNGKQVETPNICSGNQRKLGLLKREANKWIGYVPEQYAKDSKFVINVTYELKEDGTPLIQKTYEVPMTGYKDQPFDFGTNILRNHVYTLSVNDAEGVEAQVTFTIKEWEKEELFLDYTATPSVSKKLSWNQSSYESYNSNTGVVVVKPASSVESIIPVKGTFTLDSPEGATWHAFLIPTTGHGNPYAFQFKQGNGYVSTLSGTVVPGKEIEIEIYPRLVEPEENNEVMLQIVVTLGNGTVIEVPVIPDGMTYKNFTILQNKQ